MPTGYTYPVKDGKVTEFADFAMSCARAFGALASMRDGATDAEIPDEFTPTNHYVIKMAEAEAEVRRLRLLDENGREAEFVAECKLVAEENQKRKTEARESRERYENMLHWVRKWKPPTQDHHGLKDFMTEQLETSIKFYCDKPYQQDLPESIERWHGKQLASAIEDIEYYRSKHAEEVARCAKNTAWLRALRESLGLATTNAKGPTP